MPSKGCISKTEKFKNVHLQSAYHCRICKRSFKKFIIFEGHFAFNAKCRSECGWYMQCYVCGETFNHLAVLKYHLRRHNLNKTKEFIRKRSESVDRTIIHQNNECHTGIDCFICQRSFRKKIYLNEHLVWHSKNANTLESPINGDVPEMAQSSFQQQTFNTDKTEKTDKTATGNVSIDIVIMFHCYSIAKTNENEMQ